MTMHDVTAETADFAFLYGRWRVRNRRLRARLQACDTWETFEAEQWCVPLMGGIGNMDEMRGADRGVVGMSLRFFNRETQAWHIHWVAPGDGILQPAVIGRFDGGVGIFLGDDILAGVPIAVRFIWSRTTTDAPQWEQAFSADGGRTWETNWVMEFERIGAAVTLPGLPLDVAPDRHQRASENAPNSPAPTTTASTASLDFQR